MPVAAAGQADIGAADPQPVVLGGGGKHVLEELTIGLLDRGALGERPTGLGDAGSERVADALQPAEVEHPRRPRGDDPVRDVDPSQPRGDEPGQLTLEPTDLTAELGARAALDDSRPVVLGDEGRPVDLSPVEQIRHSQILSRLEGGGGNP